MKKISDYQGEEAIELWGDLLEPLAVIFADPEVQLSVTGSGSILSKAQLILSKHKKEAVQILEKIDPTPINGLNVVSRLVNLILEIKNSGEFQDFFESAAQEKTERVSSGSVMENTGAGEN